MNSMGAFGKELTFSMLPRPEFTTPLKVKVIKYLTSVFRDRALKSLHPKSLIYKQQSRYMQSLRPFRGISSCVYEWFWVICEHAFSCVNPSSREKRVDILVCFLRNKIGTDTHRERDILPTQVNRQSEPPIPLSRLDLS